MARTEMLRQRGRPYAQLESEGVFFVVARLSLRFRRPARYDDLLRVCAQSLPTMVIKVEHRYQIYRLETLLCDGETTLTRVAQR